MGCILSFDIVGRLAWQMKATWSGIMQWIKHTVSGAALWGIRTQLPLKVMDNFEWELGTDTPQGCTWDSVSAVLLVTLRGKRLGMNTSEGCTWDTVSCIISNFEWELGTGISTIIQRHTVSGAALWGIGTQLPLKVTDHFEWEQSMDTPQGWTWDSVSLYYQ